MCENNCCECLCVEIVVGYSEDMIVIFVLCGCCVRNSFVVYVCCGCVWCCCVGGVCVVCDV